MKSIRTDPKAKAKKQSRNMDEKQRRKAREESLKVLEAQKAGANSADKPPLSARLSQAALPISPRTFYIYSIFAGVIMFVLVSLLAGAPAYIGLGAGFVFAFGFPQWIVNFLRKRRFKKFTLGFPNAIDIIVRGIKSGLPLNDCVRIIANDSEEPIRGEFKKMIEATQVGLTMPEAAERLYHNIPTSETNFFAIVLSIQAGAGGNLSEALGNLSNVLRSRRKMSDKIQAVSAEAKASGAIIGGLPLAVASIVAFSSPGYLDPLFQTSTGNKILMLCGFLMAAGIGIMKKMINFKF